MAKVVVTSLKSKSKDRRETTSVTEKRVRDTGGQVKTLRTLDAGSRTFGDDLRYVFSKNVAKARRDNKRAIGTADVVIGKH
ncbi:MAG: hypothetical protein ACREJ0_26660 [Geminicoccaceae bacterium]